MEDPRHPIDTATQRRYLETLRADAAAKAEAAGAKSKTLPIGDPLRASWQRQADEHAVRARNYAAQVRAIDRGEPVATLRHERALVERELELRSAVDSPPARRAANESLGEIGAGLCLREDPELGPRYRDYYPVVGFERRTPQGYDQIWRNERGDHLVVEAKGGAHARLAPGQMDLDWVRSRGERLAASQDPRDRDAGRAVLDAMAATDRRFEGVTVAQRSPHERAEVVRWRADGGKVIDYKQVLKRQADQAAIERAAKVQRSAGPSRGAGP